MMLLVARPGQRVLQKGVQPYPGERLGPNLVALVLEKGVSRTPGDTPAR